MAEPPWGAPDPPSARTFQCELQSTFFHRPVAPDELEVCGPSVGIGARAGAGFGAPRPRARPTSYCRARRLASRRHSRSRWIAALIRRHYTPLQWVVRGRRERMLGVEVSSDQHVHPRVVYTVRRRAVQPWWLRSTRPLLTRARPDRSTKEQRTRRGRHGMNVQEGCKRSHWTLKTMMRKIRRRHANVGTAVDVDAAPPIATTAMMTTTLHRLRSSARCCCSRTSTQRLSCCLDCHCSCSLSAPTHLFLSAGRRPRQEKKRTLCPWRTLCPCLPRRRYRHRRH